MKRMDIKKIIKTQLIISFMIFFLSACAPINANDNLSSEQNSSDTSSDMIILDEEETFTINNTVEEILERFENAHNGDRLGRIDDHEIFAFICPELTNRVFFYSEDAVPVRYDDYLAVRYNPENDNEKYILLIYYFDSDGKWDSWYKYIVAKSVKEAGIITEQEQKKGYTVWTSENIVMEGEQFSEAETNEADFIAPFEKTIIHLKK